MNIHPIVYIIIGFAVSIVSYNVDYTKLILFFWVGIIFIMVGLVKFLFVFLKKELKKTKIESTPHHKSNSHNQGNYQHHKSQGNHNQKVQYNQHLAQQEVFCHNCGAKLSPKFHFCPGCGAKIK